MVADAEKKRRKLMEEVAAAKGAALPGVDADETPEEYKQRMVRRMQAGIPDNARGVAAGQVLDAVLADGIKSVPLEKSSDGDMGVDLAVGLAKQIGVSEKDLDEMLQRIAKPDDAGANQYLREQILSKLRAGQGEPGEESQLSAATAADPAATSPGMK